MPSSSTVPPIRATAYALESLRRQARAIARSGEMSRQQALEMLARTHGWPSYRALHQAFLRAQDQGHPPTDEPPSAHPSPAPSPLVYPPLAKPPSAKPS